MSQQNQSQLDQPEVRDFITALVEQHGETNAGIVKSLWASKFRIDTTKDSIRRFRKRHKLTPPPAQGRPGIRYNGDEADLTGRTQIGLHMDDPDAMLQERGLDPAQWLIDSALRWVESPADPSDPNEGSVAAHCRDW